MKQLLLILISILFSLNVIQAQEKSSYENTTWKVIWERLFNGENSHVFRYENDIRFQLEGIKTQQDSAIFVEMIAELNELLETAEIRMVNDNPNFVLKIVAGNGISVNRRIYYSGSTITSTILELDFTDISKKEQVAKHSYYHVIRLLTKLFEPRHGHSGYGGIFDYSKPEDSEFHKIDKDLLRKVYSQDFYTQLRKHTIQSRGLSFYLNLRYENLMKNLLLSVRILLIIFGFLYFLSKESKREKNPTLWLYIKQRTIILLIIPFIFSVINVKPGDLTTFIFASPVLFVANFLGTLIYALLVLILIYYTEPFFLKKINGFASKQSFIFISTIVSVEIFPITIALLYLLFNNTFALGQLNFTSILVHGSSHLFLVVFLATLRVFYNFINYRIQGLVNQKDVELAKMKELKNQAELNALHSRINPHFLYNSLNSIASLAHINADKTENMATGLSELFRYSINKENKTFVTVNEELEMVEKYLVIEKTRFEDKLIYTIEAEEAVKQKMIPKFLIQPLAENAIKHGLSKIKGLGKITISVKQVDKNMVITIFDNGPDFPEEPVSGYGLQNLNDKLEIIYGNDAFINWENGENKHFQITIKNKF